MIMRRSVPLIVALAATASLTVTTSAVASPSSRPSPGQPKANARSAGITPSGGGYAGWSMRSHSSTRMSPDSATGPLQANAVPRVLGMDVSAYQGKVNWKYYYKHSRRFAYVKATEGTYYKSATFKAQFSGAAKAGLLRGAYHFANPSWTGGKAQANYFVKHGGKWTRDGKTLPGMLDLESNPYGAMCYGLTKSQMVKWITAFSNRYRTLTSRDIVFYTTYNWWKKCTGNTRKFNQTNPLWIARWASSPGTLPGGWPYYTFWQYASTTYDKDRFNGSMSRLRVLAHG